MKYRKFTQRITSFLLTAAFVLTEVSAIPQSVFAENIQAADSIVQSEKNSSTEIENDYSSILDAVPEASADIVENIDSSSTSEKQADTVKSTVTAVPQTSASSETTSLDTTAPVTSAPEQQTTVHKQTSAKKKASSVSAAKTSVNLNLKAVTMLAEADDVVTDNCGKMLTVS